MNVPSYHADIHATGAVLPGIETAVFFQTGSGSSWASKVAKTVGSEVDVAFHIRDLHTHLSWSDVR